MTGIECLRKEMEKRGLNKSQQNSKVAAVVLDILSETGTEYTSVWDAEQTLDSLNRKISNAQSQLDDLNAEIAGTNDSVNTRRRLVEMQFAAKKRELDADKEYINHFLSDLENCETPEGRDAMRQAQVYINTVEPLVQSAYDRTAFIASLAAVMTGGKFDNIKELKKINPKIFD